jgi:DMSO/TMAO reductase YedYZ molybdopterin-dependent catalytic subunit
MKDEVTVVTGAGHYSEFMLEDAPGFWELRVYHMYGDPRKEQRL